MAAERRTRPCPGALLAGALVLLALAAGASGCGVAAGPGVPAAAAAGSSEPRPLAQQSPVSATFRRVTPAEYRVPIARYRRYVAARLGEVGRDVTRLRRAVARADLPGARGAWRGANAAYASIGAAYGAFGALGAAVDTGTGGLPRGVRDRRFTGLHRVELALFGRGSTTDAAAPAAGLARAVRRMRLRMPTLTIAPLDYSLRVHEILEDTLHLQLTGEASPWSGAAYDGVAANVAGTREVLRTLRPMIDARARARRVQADASLRTLEAALRRLRRPDGRMPLLPAVPAATRARIAALVAGSTEVLAALPEVIDPRPPRPVRSPYAQAP